jgi:hypothetical protein
MKTYWIVGNKVHFVEGNLGFSPIPSPSLFIAPFGGEGKERSRYGLTRLELHIGADRFYVRQVDRHEELCTADFVGQSRHKLIVTSDPTCAKVKLLCTIGLSTSCIRS